MKKYRKHLATTPIIAILVLTGISAVAQKQKREHVTATAMGTSTQLGQIVNVDLRITEFSSSEDQQVLLAVFAEKGSQGLANALEKMNSKGRLAITGTLGYDVNYIREFKMPDGSRRIRFVTDRAIRFREAWHDTRTMDYQLSLGEVIISPSKGKSSGTLMPVARLKLNKKGDLEIETYQNPWNLTNIKVYK